MSPERYAQIREIYLQVQAAPPDQRASVVEQACGSDQALRLDLESLLAPIDRGDGAGKVFGRRLQRWLSHRMVRIWGLALILFLSMAFTEILRRHIRTKMEQDVADQLRTSLRSRHDSIDFWFHNRLASIHKLAQNSELQRAVQKLHDLARYDDSGELLKNAPEQGQLHALITTWSQAARYNHFAVWNLNFTVIATDMPALIGRRVIPEEEVLAALLRLRQGQPVLMPRRLFGSGVGAQPTEKPEFVTVFGVPIRNDQGTVIGGLFLSLDAEANLDRILAMGQWKVTGEQFIFNAQGMLLSDLRLHKDLVQAGLIQDHESPTLKLKILNPGGNLLQGEASFGDRQAWPLTRAVGLAIAAGKAGEKEAQSGVILTPYRDIRGVPVVGAWLWNQEFNFGMVSEIDAHEAFFSADLVDSAILILYAVTSVFALLALVIRLKSVPRHLPGSRLGPYRLLRRIGEGGLGEVYLARHELLKRPTAIKILRASVGNRACIERFEREVQATCRLSHPNTVAIYDYGRSRLGHFYYAMEYLMGMTLARLLTLEKQIPVSRALHFLIQMVHSLREAHRAGLIHRDIKPLNIMVCQVGGEYDVIKVLDFGLVKQIPVQDLSETASASKDVYGTPMYMAPECLQEPFTCDGRADIYSWAVVAYKMLSGQDPFAATHDLALLYDVLFTQPEPLHNLRPDLDPALAQLVMRCLEKSPERRPASMDALKECLDSITVPDAWTSQAAEAWWQHRASF